MQVITPQMFKRLSRLGKVGKALDFSFFLFSFAYLGSMLRKARSPGCGIELGNWLQRAVCQIQRFLAAAVLQHEIALLD